MDNKNNHFDNSYMTRFSKGLYRSYIRLWGPSISSYRKCHFNHLLSEYYTKGGTETEQSESKLGAVIKAFKADQTMGWDDICTLEIAIINALDRTNLILREKQLKARYQSVADEDRFSAYEQATKELSAEKIDADVLRQQTIHLANQIYWSYSVVTQAHKIRDRVSQIVTYFFIAILICVFTFSDKGGNNDAQHFSLMISTVSFGAFGAYISFQRRMSKLRIQNETYLAFLQLRSSYFDGLGAMFSGSMFAIFFVILWQSTTLSIIFSQDVLKILLPEIDKVKAESPCVPSVFELFSCLSVHNIATFSKLMVMSFLAGFAETLVPDAIDSVVGKTRPKT